MDELLDFEKQGGLITAVVQHAGTGRVLMVGYMNREALDKTLTTGNVTFFSRSRQKLWMKGETSGHFLKLRAIATDCDGDALLVQAEPIGPGVCHEGYESCFFRTLKNGTWQESEAKVYDSDAVYSAQAAGCGPEGKTNSADLAASGESGVRELLKSGSRDKPQVIPS